MSADQFIGEIRFFPFNFAPVDWMDCDGRLLSIAQNAALFSLLETNYGGDGISTFGVPDLRGRVPIGANNGVNALSIRNLGDRGGAEVVTLTEAHLPAHTHQLQGVAAPADDNEVAAANLPAQPKAGNIYGATGAANPMAADTLAQTGGGQPHNNMQPYLTGRYCIAIAGIFPARP